MGQGGLSLELLTLAPSTTWRILIPNSSLYSIIKYGGTLQFEEKYEKINAGNKNGNVPKGYCKG